MLGTVVPLLRTFSSHAGWVGDGMAAGAGDFGAGGRLDPGVLMEQVKVQIAVANAQELLQVRGGRKVPLKSRMGD